MTAKTETAPARAPSRRDTPPDDGRQQLNSTKTMKDSMKTMIAVAALALAIGNVHAQS
jgi:hypothetical protein